MQKVAIFVDVQNIYYTVREAFGKQFNYREFWSRVTEGRKVIGAFAYAIERNDVKQKSFQQTLRNIGFEVKLKPFIQRRDGSAKGDWDVGITLDMLEFAEQGSLRDIIAREDMVVTLEDMTLRMAGDIAGGMHYLHTRPRPVIHRDLKSDNVLVTASFAAKLADFGVSKETSDTTMAETFVGTAFWLAPEVGAGKEYTIKADVYSFAILLCELGIPSGDVRDIFENKPAFKVVTDVGQGWRPTIPEIITKDWPLLAGVIERCHCRLQLSWCFCYDSVFDQRISVAAASTGCLRLL